MNDITPKEASEILRHYTNLGYGIIIEGDDISKIIQALSLARKTLANGTPYNPTGDLISRSELMKAIGTMVEAEMPIDEKWALGLKHSLKVIDNAPTVEPRDNFDLGYVKGLEDGKDKLIKELWNCRNELCLRCGKYEKAHRGACDDCRYNFKNMEQYKRGDDK